MNFPGGPEVKNLPCNAGDAGSIPNQGTKIPQVVGQLSPLDIAREFLNCNESSHITQNILRAKTKTQHSQINKLEKTLCRNSREKEPLIFSPECIHHILIYYNYKVLVSSGIIYGS